MIRPLAGTEGMGVIINRGGRAANRGRRRIFGRKVFGNDEGRWTVDEGEFRTHGCIHLREWPAGRTFDTPPPEAYHPATFTYKGHRDDSGSNAFAERHQDRSVCAGRAAADGPGLLERAGGGVR